MTEFENASLIIASIGAAAAIVNAIAVTVAAFGIWRGIGAMDRANKERAATLDQQREADERRHAEAMTALNEMIQSGDKRHAESMTALNGLIQSGDKRHAESMTALNELIRSGQRRTAALDELLRRSASEPAA